MQEVFEKIKERLEEKAKEYERKAFAMSNPATNLFAQYMLGAKLSLEDEAIENVNQVAEEYSDGWIPCSERLPDIYTSVLITYRRQHDGYSKVVVARMQADCEWKIEFGGYCGSENVVAWQPLPEPYKEVER